MADSDAQGPESDPAADVTPLPVDPQSSPAFAPPPPFPPPPPPQNVDRPEWSGSLPGPPDRRRKDFFAVAGFVASLFICIVPYLFPAALLLGIVGIIRTRHGRRRGRGLAIAAVVICSVLILLGVAVNLGYLKAPST